MSDSQRIFSDTPEGKRKAVERYGDDWADFVNFFDEEDQPENAVSISERLILDALVLTIASGEMPESADVNAQVVDSKRTALGMPRGFAPGVSYVGNEAEVILVVEKDPNWRNLP